MLNNSSGIGYFHGVVDYANAEGNGTVGIDDCHDDSPTFLANVEHF
jgi:hypothetical protein